MEEGKIVIPAEVQEILSKNNLGIKLDVGCGSNKQPGYVGMDKRKVEGVDIVHDAEVFPYPLPDGCCSTILLSHLIEHIKPWLMIDLMDELWRLAKVGGQLLISTPYAGSFGYWQDPTHCNGCNEATWTYFDPDYFLYRIYQPKPWRIARNAWWETGNMEIVLEKRDKAVIAEKPKNVPVNEGCER
jgi:SAM-dependent methyltransferase